MKFKSRLDEVIFDGLRVCDAIIVLLTAFIAYFVRHGTLILPSYYLIGVVLSSVIFIIAAQGVGVYTIRVNLSQVRCMLSLVIALLLTAVIYLSFLFVIKSSDEISRLWLFYWIGISFFILNLLHMSFIRWLKKRVYSGSFQRSAVLYTDADQAQAYIDFFKGRKEFEIKAVVISGLLLADDWGSQTGLMISLSMWRKFFKPHYRRIFDEIHRLGRDIIFHSCGNVMGIIPDLIELGVDVIDPVQPGAMKIDEVARQFGGSISFCGGIDDQRLETYTPEEIRDVVRRTVGTLGSPFGNAYIGAPANLVPPTVPFENLAAMFETFHES